MSFSVPSGTPAPEAPQNARQSSALSYCASAPLQAAVTAAQYASQLGGQTQVSESGPASAHTVSSVRARASTWRRQCFVSPSGVPYSPSSQPAQACAHSASVAKIVGQRAAAAGQ